MASEFDQVMRDATVVMRETFGARDAQGDLGVILYESDRREPIPLTGWIVSSVRGQEQINPQRVEIDLVETLMISGPADVLRARGVTGFERSARVKIGEVAYQTDPLTTQFGPVTVTLGLKRKPLIARNEGRATGI